MGRGSRQTGRRASPSGRVGARERPRARSRWDAIRRLLGSGEDPYAGADIRISRNAVAVLSAVHGALVLLLDRIVRVFATPEGAILLRADGGSRLEVRAARGLATESRRRVELPVSALATRIAREREAVAFEVDGDHSVGSEGTGPQSVLGVPLMVDRRLLGVLYVASRTDRRFVQEDVALLQLVGDRVALAVDRARRFERERHIAETLQRSLLPEKLPRIPGTEGAARYLPAGAGTE